MSEPKNLQQRVEKAFKDKSLAPAVADSGNEADDAHADRPGAGVGRLLGYWFGGISLAGSALILTLGAGVGHVLLALLLGIVGIGTILYRFVIDMRAENEAASSAHDQALPALASARPAERRLRRDLTAGAMLGKIHDALGDIALCRSLTGEILSANHTFRQATRCDRPEGRSCEQLGIRFIAGPVEHCFDVWIRTPAGTRIFVWHDVVVQDPILGDLVIQSIARDVTSERHHARIQEEARERAEQDSDLKSRLIATVSHEIRTPLSGLLGMGHLLAGTRLSPEQKNYLDGISQSGTALVQLVEDLLDFSTLAAGRFQLRPKRETIRPLIEGVVELLSSRAHAKGIEIGATIATDLPETLILDPARFRQVLYNVIGNAVKFTEAGGVLVSAGLDGSTLVVRVRDTGPGMNEAETQRIFGEFEQGELSRAREGGVGLGLAISARIMSETGGSLSVESKLGEGSTFVIRLPVSTDFRAMRSGQELGGAKVMLLAPFGPAATALATTLKSLGAETYAVSTASDAESMLLLSEGFTGIIVDHRLDPDFTATLSRNPRLAGAKRVYLVNPESRPAQMSGDDYDSWLIRPLREQSLIDVLTGKLRGLEVRPAASEEFPVIAAEVHEDEASPSGPEAARSLSILLGEDDPVNAMISQAILEKAGHRVELAENFSRLAAAFAEARPDIVLTDYSMPDGTSDTFISRLREMEESAEHRPVPVIVLTADGSEETRRKLLVNGADLVLTKPATPDMLNGAIIRLTERLIRAA